MFDNIIRIIWAILTLSFVGLIVYFRKPLKSILHALGDMDILKAGPLEFKRRAEKVNQLIMAPEKRIGYSGLFGDSHEWQDFKPYTGLFRNYWRFHATIDEITSKGKFLHSFAARAVPSNSYTSSCRCGWFLRINSLTSRHSGQSPFYAYCPQPLIGGWP